MTWNACERTLPADGVPVMTKIANPDRNEQVLVRRENLWFLPDMSMYVYYRPTHWKMMT